MNTRPPECPSCSLHGLSDLDPHKEFGLLSSFCPGHKTDDKCIYHGSIWKIASALGTTLKCACRPHQHGLPVATRTGSELPLRQDNTNTWSIWVPFFHLLNSRVKIILEPVDYACVNVRQFISIWIYGPAKYHKLHASSMLQAACSTLQNMQIRNPHLV